MPTTNHNDRTRYHLIDDKSTSHYDDHVRHYVDDVCVVYLAPCHVDDCTRDHYRLALIDDRPARHHDYHTTVNVYPASNERGGGHATDVADDDVTTVVAHGLYGADAWAAFTRATRNGR